MKKNAEILLTELSGTNFAISARDLFDAFESKDKGYFSGAESVSKLLNYLMTRNGLVKNGESEIIKERTFLTWLITDKGREAINESKDNAKAQNTVESVRDGALLAPTDATNDYAIEPNMEKLMQDKNDAIGHIIDELFLKAKEGVIELVEAVALENAQHSITGLAIKIATLKRLSPIMTDDISQVLDDIACDLERLDG